ncbi:MAG: cellulase family glycosylhydrolase [Chloroflexia bacterium]|nr:cellulase family glycosylhydrolase [Chloroflexia bacterium]
MEEFRANYITEADIQRIKELGFNSVRPALNSRLFITEEENPKFIDEGFILLDSLINWCKNHNVYVIIDMHGAPGGQTGQNIDDSPKDEPELFMYEKKQDLLVEFWQKIAEKYKNEPIVAAYNLLNEPLPEHTGAAEKYKHMLVPLYERLIKEIRKIDQKHMITIEGYNWSNNWSLFSKPLDNNIFYQFHYYCWDRPDNLNSINYFLKKRDTLNTPVWVGETGEKGNTIYWATAQYFETNNIGFSFWPWKKMDTQNTPYSIKKPENWDVIAEYSNGGEKPDTIIAEIALTEFLENIKLKNCMFFPDVVNAVFYRVPGKIEAENYGHLGFNKSYFVSDTSERSPHYRKWEPVKIEVNDSTKEQFWSEQWVVLNADEWLEYQFDAERAKEYSTELKIYCDSDGKVAEFIVNDNMQVVSLNSKGWNEVKLETQSLKSKNNKLRIIAKNQLKIDWIRFND